MNKTAERKWMWPIERNNKEPQVCCAMAQKALPRNVIVEAVHLANDDEKNDGQTLVKALETLGFALVVAPDILSVALTQRSLQACAELLDDVPTGSMVLGVRKNSPKVTTKRRLGDHKESVVLRREHVQENGTIKECWNALQQIKGRVLKILERELSLPNPLEPHQEETDSMRSLSCPALSKDLASRLKKGNRCHAHADHGAVTLLIVGRPGLEAQSKGGHWIQTPRDNGIPAVAVNVGREMSVDVSKSRLIAALHRAPGPHSEGSQAPRDIPSASDMPLRSFVKNGNIRTVQGREGRFQKMRCGRDPTPVIDDCELRSCEHFEFELFFVC